MSATAGSVRPPISARKSSRMAGSFDPESDLLGEVSDEQEISETSASDREHDFSDSLQSHDHDHRHESDHDPSSLLPPLVDEPSSLLEKLSNSTRNPLNRNYESDFLPNEVSNTVLEEQEMNMRLGDYESSFLPEPSMVERESLGDESLGQRTHPQLGVVEHSDNATAPETLGRSPEYPPAQTPPAVYKTPVPDQQELRLQQQDHSLSRTPDLPNTSALEQMSSSPTAARTVSRVQSLATLGGYETAAEHDDPDSPLQRAPRARGRRDLDETPRQPEWSSSQDASSTLQVLVPDPDLQASAVKRRPQYLNRRSSHARLSYDSMASSTTETSDATLGADYALQSGGAAPGSSRLQRRGKLILSRTASLGSMVSGVTGMSDDETQDSSRPVTSASLAPELSTLNEESPNSQRMSRESPNAAVTPRASAARLAMPTESAITNHVRDLEVPGTVARKYRAEQGTSPEQTISAATMTPASRKGLTLKEHRSTVEKLGKENFDLKMKIHFLDQALQRRSEDGVKEMITENVQLKSDRMRLEKDNHGLRKQIRDLQKRLDAATGSKDSEDPGYATDEERSPTIMEEVLYLRERVEVNEVEIEKLRQDNLAKETEKRRLAEMVRNLGDHRAGSSEVGSREERDMWKDMLEAETIAREQAEDDAKKLRDEVAKFRQESTSNGGRASKLRSGTGSVLSRSSSVERSKANVVDKVEVDRLRHEISELQKTIGAQASALTSRNKEKERLYQEIEDLKIGRMGGLRSVAGDSIFERSASRARSNSRASNGTRYTRLSEGEREHLEGRINELRDETSQLRLDRQHLQSQLDEALTDLEAIDVQAQNDADQFAEEIQLLTHERDNAMRDADEQDQAFQQLKNEAQEEIDGLGDELDAKIEECARLDEELKAQAENVKALQTEMRSASEGLIRLEEDAQTNLSRYQSVRSELNDANRDLESVEKGMVEAEGKIQRLTVQQESSRNEIAFLREEQDGDKIKIGDLESLLKKVHLNLEAERDRARDFERRLHEERHQRDVVVNQEKQEVQRVINDLNREVSNVKDELRRARKTLASREIELNSSKERLGQLEDSLRNIVNDPAATSSQLIGSMTKMQREHEQAVTDLDATRGRLDEHVKLVADRDGLLESSALESRRLVELVERERQARRQDQHSFEQSLKSHQQAARMVSAGNTRIAELEQARQGHRKQLSQIESSYKDQLAERNQILLNIWKRLSAMCGPDWTHNHALINGNLPSQEVIGSMLFWPGFSRNLLLAAKQVEGVISSFKEKIKRVERDLWRDYNNLEKELEMRTKKLERIEEAWEEIKLKEREIEAGLVDRSPSRSRSASAKPTDVQRLKGENRLLKAELNMLQQAQRAAAQPHHPHHPYSLQSHGRGDSRSSTLSGVPSSHDGLVSIDEAASVNTSTATVTGPGAANGVATGGIPHRSSSMRRQVAHSISSLSRSHSANTVESMSRYDAEKSTPTMTRSNSVASGRNSVYGDGRDMRRSLVVPGGPVNAPANGNFAVPPASAATGSNPNPNLNFSNALLVGSGSGAGAGSGSPDAGTITSQNSKNVADEGRWIHRLRELERRLKSEREQRLVDRSGMRRRLEERDAVNEELRRELERERAARGWKEDHHPQAQVHSYHQHQSQTPTSTSTHHTITHSNSDLHRRLQTRDKEKDQWDRERSRSRGSRSTMNAAAEGFEAEDHDGTGRGSMSTDGR